MKKRTVIKTEKHEVWVIRSPADTIAEQQPIQHGSEAGSENLCPVDSEEPASVVPSSEGMTSADSNKEKSDNLQRE